MNVRVTTRGRIVVPAAVRRQLGIKPGTRIRVELDVVTRQLILTPITPEYVRSLRGSLRGKGALEMLEAERRKERGRDG